MSIDYIVASLPILAFEAPPGITREDFDALAKDAIRPALEKWRDIETQLRNAMALCRKGGEKWVREAKGCSIYWKNRVAACFQEKDVAKRDEMLDRVWWDAAEELAAPSSPLGVGALAAYSVRLDIAIKRSRISREKGETLFDESIKTKTTKPQDI